MSSPRNWALTPLLSGVLLLALAGVSFAVSFVPLHAWALPVALAIAVAKAGVVLVAFMGLGQQGPSARLAALAALLMLLLLTGLMLADPLTRDPPPLTSAGLSSPNPAAREMPGDGHGHEQ